MLNLITKQFDAMHNFEVNKGKQLLRSSITALITTSVLMGCTLETKPNLEQSTSATKEGYCFNGGKDSEYSCDPKDAEPQVPLHTKATDDQWMQAKLAEIKNWIANEKKAVIDGKTSSPTAAGNEPTPAITESDFITTVSTPAPAIQSAFPVAELERILKLSREGQHGAAISAVNTVVKAHPKQAAALLTKGIVLKNKGDNTAAKAVFQDLMTSHPDRPEPFNNLAVIYAEEGNYPLAIETLQNAFKTHPSYAQVHSNLKELYATLASQAYSKALDLGGESSGPNLALINTVPSTTVPSTSVSTLASPAITTSIVTSVTQTAVTTQAQANKDTAVLSIVSEPKTTPAVVVNDVAVIDLNAPNADSSEPIAEASVTETSTTVATSTPVIEVLPIDNVDEQTSEVASQTISQNTSQTTDADPFDDGIEVAANNITNSANASQNADLENEPATLEEVTASAQSDASDASEDITLATVAPEPITNSESAKPATLNQLIASKIQHWADAWSNKNHAAYVSAYTPSYRPNAKLSHNAWVTQRAQRLSKPKFIKVELSNIEVNVLRENIAEVRFDQRYQSDTYQDAVRKRVMMVNTDNDWKISLETTLGVIQ